jgi:hypothetical protein
MRTQVSSTSPRKERYNAAMLIRQNLAYNILFALPGVNLPIINIPRGEVEGIAAQWMKRWYMYPGGSNKWWLFNTIDDSLFSEI